MVDTKSLVPAIIALALTSVITIGLSLVFKGEKLATYQTLLFACLFGISTYHVVQHVDELDLVIKLLNGLSEELRLSLSVAVIGAVYFGGSFYVFTGGSESQTKDAQLQTPASVDSVVTFEIPAHLPSDDKVLFDQVFDKLKKEIVADLPTVYEMPSEAVTWVDRMIQYTVAGGKLNRGLATVAVRKTLAEASGHSLTPKERLQSAALGWCVEFLQAFFLVADDVMDASVTRRGQPCWYRLPEVKLIAINDSFILESCVFKILKRYFGAETYYPELVDLFIEVTRQTELGQLLDLTSQLQDGVIDLSRFTQERYSSIVKYKTAFYSFYLPVALSMIVAGITDRRLYEKAREILLIMGEYFQVQDDYLDCYGTPEVIGKIGTDIQDNKCSWLVVQALKRATPAQRQILEENYGRHDENKVQRIKKLYIELNIEKIYLDYEEESYKQIQNLLKQSKDLPQEVFTFLLNKIYKRSK